jgi:hypothetical protein
MNNQNDEKDGDTTTYKEDDDDVKQHRTTCPSHDDTNVQYDDDVWHVMKQHIAEQLIFQYGFPPDVVRDVIEKVIVDVAVMGDEEKDVSSDRTDIKDGTSYARCDAMVQHTHTANKKYQHYDNIQELIDMCCQYI